MDTKQKVTIELNGLEVNYINTALEALLQIQKRKQNSCGNPRIAAIYEDSIIEIVDLQRKFVVQK